MPDWPLLQNSGRAPGLNPKGLLHRRICLILSLAILIPLSFLGGRLTWPITSNSSSTTASLPPAPMLSCMQIRRKAGTNRRRTGPPDPRPRKPRDRRPRQDPSLSGRRLGRNSRERRRPALPPHWRDGSVAAFSHDLLDPHDSDPARRYKLFKVEFYPPFDPATHGVIASYSADGVHFTSWPRAAVLHRQPYAGSLGPRTENSDLPAGVLLRIRKPAAHWADRNRRSTFSLALSTRPTTIACSSPSTTSPVVLAADAEDDPHSDIYYNASSIYSWLKHLPDVHRAVSALLSRPQSVRPPAVPGQWEDFGMLEVQLAVSRDGVHWTGQPRALCSDGLYR